MIPLIPPRPKPPAYPLTEREFNSIRRTKSQQAMYNELHDLLKSMPEENRLAWLRTALLDTENPAKLEPWAEALSSAAANERHAKRMDQWGGTEIAEYCRRK